MQCEPAHLSAAQVFGSKDGPPSSGPGSEVAPFGTRKKGGERPNLDVDATLDAVEGYMKVRHALQCPHTHTHTGYAHSTHTAGLT